LHALPDAIAYSPIAPEPPDDSRFGYDRRFTGDSRFGYDRRVTGDSRFGYDRRFTGGSRFG